MGVDEIQVRLYGPRARPSPEQRRDADGGFGEKAPAPAAPPAQPSDRSFDEWLSAEERQREYEMVGAPLPQQQRREQQRAAQGGGPRGGGGGGGGDARGEARAGGGAARGGTGAAPVRPTAGWQDRLEGGAGRGGPPRRERGPPPPQPQGGVRTTGLSFRKEDRADRGRGGGGGGARGERGAAGDRASRPRALPPDGPRRDGGW